ncbi:MAG: phosphoenolpyruvate--protein phosphotransferase [Ponticaulis sp.]|nr:phosphoenolpyruvate--protein phosphotransferase [Ponticaulis sp.]
MTPPDRPPRPATAVAPRVLMTRLRSLMAEGRSLDGRLAGVVSLVARSFVADVCSIYLRLENGDFELVATEGLKAEAVKNTRLARNEGLIGLVASEARPQNIQNAPHHPRFSYRPETGEDPYTSFLGVPILRFGRVIGVLAVQNIVSRVYDEEDMETLQTIAMVLAEVVTTESQSGSEELADVAVRPNRPIELIGQSLSEGLAMGPIHLHDPVVAPAQFFARDINDEEVRLKKALEQLRSFVDTMMVQNISPLAGESRDILETYRMLAHDPSWANRLFDAVSSGLSAEAAVDRARREHRARLQNAKDSYLRDRLHDLEDLDNRLLRMLSGNGEGIASQDHDGAILVARRLGPADLLEYRNAGLKALVLEDESTTSHAVIVARALGLPLIGGVGRIMAVVETGDEAIVDGDTGHIHIRPEPDLVAVYRDRLASRSQRLAEFAAIRDLPAVTQDGVKIELLMNAGLGIDVGNLDASGAEGIGLFRTEFQFLVSETLPSLTEQREFYQRVVDIAEDRPVLFRTLDLGGDKILRNTRHNREENPALGWRSLRFALDKPGLFRRQLRALCQATAGRTLCVMFPLVTTPEEFRKARELLNKEVAWCEKHGHSTPQKIHVGAMIETPAFALSFHELKGEIDFLSIGTNDLHQYFFAADRDSRFMSDRYSILNHTFLLFLKDIRKRADEMGIPVSICGEAAGNPAMAKVFALLGFRRLSMPATGVGPVKRAIRNLNLSELGVRFEAVLSENSSDIDKDLLNLLQDV